MLPFVNKALHGFCPLFVRLARNFEYTKTPRESILAMFDCHLAHPTPSHTPSAASLNFAGGDSSCEELYLSASEVQCFT